MQKRQGRLLQFRPAVRIGGWLTAAAAAAAILVVLLRPDAPLPGYQIASVSGGSSEMRGEPAGDFAPGDPVEVRLRPETATRESLEAQLFLAQGDELRELEAQSEFFPGGSVKMESSLGHDLQQGTWTLWAVVGRPGDLPDPPELRSQEGRSRGEDWIAV